VNNPSYKAIKPYLLAPLAKAFFEMDELMETDFEAICNDPDHTFYDEAARLYGLMVMGEVIVTAGGDVKYWMANLDKRPYKSTNEVIERANLGTLFTEWAIAYQDEGGLYVL
jgi:hypothetical protein